MSVWIKASKEGLFCQGLYTRTETYFAIFNLAESFDEFAFEEVACAVPQVAPY